MGGVVNPPVIRRGSSAVAGGFAGEIDGAWTERGSHAAPRRLAPQSLARRPRSPLRASRRGLAGGCSRWARGNVLKAPISMLQEAGRTRGEERKGRGRDGSNNDLVVGSVTAKGTGPCILAPRPSFSLNPHHSPSRQVAVPYFIGEKRGGPRSGVICLKSRG